MGTVDQGWLSSSSPVTLVHSLNCALLIPSKGQPDEKRECSCGAVPKPDRLAHNHGPDEGRGLDCPEYTLASGERVGHCNLTDGERSVLGLKYRPAPAPAPRAATVPPAPSDSFGVSQGEVRTTSATGGQKGVKEERFDLLPPEALAVVARHYAIGARKYGEHNWRKGHEWSKAYAAMQRHLHAWLGGEDLDPETGSPHLAAVVAHALTLLTFSVEHPEFDDRFKKGTPSGSE